MKLKCLPLVGVFALGSPAFAITVNVTDFVFSAPKDVSTIDALDPRNDYSGAAGQFSGTIGGSNVASASLSARRSPNFSGSSFTAYCAEIKQDFLFGVSYDYTSVTGLSYLGAQKTSDLSRLFTAYNASVVDSASSAAMQAAIWEIIFEQGGTYSLTSGNFTVVAENTSDAAAFGAVNTILGSLSDYAASYSIDVLTNADAQDFLVATIPEPQTWALLAGGLGLLGLMARRRKA